MQTQTVNTLVKQVLDLDKQLAEAERDKEKIEEPIREAEAELKMMLEKNKKLKKKLELLQKESNEV